MPTYGYRCPGCGHEFEKFQKMTDNARVMCPRCRKRAERLISGGAGIVFKGSGFYETDYRRAKPDKKPDSKDKTTKKEKSPDATKSETKKKSTKGDDS